MVFAGPIVLPWLVQAKRKMRGRRQTPVALGKIFPGVVRSRVRFAATPFPSQGNPHGAREGQGGAGPGWGILTVRFVASTAASIPGRTFLFTGLAVPDWVGAVKADRSGKFGLGFPQP